MVSLSLTNVGSPTITVAVAPITQLNIAVLSSVPQVNLASVTLAGLQH
jgi:hypothetical protein